jgi:hypothetical protein
MNLKSIAAAAVLAACSSAFAQSPKPGAAGGAVVASEPGKAVAAVAVEATANVVAIEKQTRTITLKGAEGRVVDLVAGEEVRNFDQIRVGDRVTVKYMEALSLELRKVRSNEKPSVTAGAAAAKPGEKPAGAMGAEVHAIADVVRVDPKAGIISLKGPRGNVVDLKVRNPEHFKVVKKGDQVDVTYTQAVALAVTPAPKAAKK